MAEIGTLGSDFIFWKFSIRNEVSVDWPQVPPGTKKWRTFLPETFWSQVLQLNTPSSGQISRIVLTGNIMMIFNLTNSTNSDTLLWKKGLRALVDFSTMEMVHLESISRDTDWGFMDSSHWRALTEDLACLDIKTHPDSSLLGIVKPDSGVTWALAQSKLESKSPSQSWSAVCWHSISQ